MNATRTLALTLLVLPGLSVAPAFANNLKFQAPQVTPIPVLKVVPIQRPGGAILPFKPDAVDGGLREDRPDIDTFRGPGRFEDVLGDGGYEASSGGIAQLPESGSDNGATIGGRSDFGPSAEDHQDAQKGDGSFTGRDWGPEAPPSRPGDTTSSHPGSPTDGVADRSGQASGDGPKDHSETVTTITVSENSTETKTTTTHPDGSRDEVSVTNYADGTIENAKGHFNPDGSGFESIRNSTLGTIEQTTDRNGGGTARIIPPPDSQPDSEGNTIAGTDGCLWNPLAGCTKAAWTEASIREKFAQPGPGDEGGSSSTGSGAPNIGPEAVTNSDEQHLRGGNTGDGQPYDPRDDFDGEGGGVPTPRE